MNRTNDSRLKVLYILGSSRCGSTILDNILGEIDGFFSAGEIRFLWQRLLQRRFCGCGLHMDECPVWSRVIKSSLSQPGLAGADAKRVVEWERQFLRFHRTFPLLRQERAPVSSEFAALLSLSDAMYRSLAETTSARVIVDSSKRSSEGALLRLLPSVQPFFVHLVRDPRAMVYSQRRQKVNPDREGSGELEAIPPALSCVYWSASNVGAEVLCRREPGRSMRLRYEDFMLHPRIAIERIAEMVGERSARVPFVDDTHVDLGLNHTVSGNPTRFQRGRVELKLDDRWKTEMSPFDRRLTSTLVFPLMLRYGYLGKDP